MERKGELIIDVVLLTPVHGFTSGGRLAKTSFYRLSMHKRWYLEDLRWMIGMDGERESENYVLSVRLNKDTRIIK